MECVVNVIGVSKTYAIYHKPYEPLLALIPYFEKKLMHHTALDSVSLQVYKGEFVGIIGKNGSGKSTLLKIICGVLAPNVGKVEIKGRVLSLLELGTGFDLELSGRENLFLAAELMGFDVGIVKAKIEEIEAFADIEEYFDAPMKTYSSGMYVRLAMSMFLHLEPEIFIIDEALGVGDIFFQQKCFAKIDEMRRNGTTFILVSHDLGLIQKVCDRVAYLEHGRLAFFGDRIVACKLFFDSQRTVALAARACNGNDLPINDTIANLIADKVPLIQSDKAFIRHMRIMNKDGKDDLGVDMMDRLVFEIGIELDESLEYPAISILLKNRTGLLVSCMTNQVDNRGFLILKVEIVFSIEPGEYSVDLYVGERHSEIANTGETLCSYERVCFLTVRFDYENQRAPYYGLCYMENKLSVQKGIEC